MGAAASIVDVPIEEDKKMMLTIPSLRDLPDAMDIACFQFERHPLILDDAQGNAERYLRYNGTVLHVDRAKDMEPERLRTSFLGCLKAGSTLTISFGDDPPDLSKIPVSEKYFPEQILDRRSCLDQSVWSKLLHDDESKPDRFALEIRGTMTLCCVTRNAEIPDDLYRVLKVIRVGSSDTKKIEEKNDDDTAVNEMFGLTKEIIRNSEDMAESAFDGDIEDVKRLLEKGFHIDSTEENDHSALSEAACQGHNELVQFLLENGADPNQDASKGDGKAPLYRAAFNGHLETVRLLLEAGADPDKVCTSNEESPADAATESEVVELLVNYDRELTQKALEVRKKKILEERDKRIRTAAEREHYAREDLTKSLIDLSSKGDAAAVKEAIEEEVRDAELMNRPLRGGASTTRDSRGNSLLSIASWKGNVDVVKMLLEMSCSKERDSWSTTRKRAWRVNVNSKDRKGWTPICIASFHNHKGVVEVLLQNGADPLLKNSYGKNAFDLVRSGPTAPDVSLMRWYDEKLLQKDLERERDAKRKMDLEGGGVISLLEAWRREQRGCSVEEEVVENKKKKKEEVVVEGSMKKKKLSTKSTTKKKKKKKTKKKKK